MGPPRPLLYFEESEGRAPEAVAEQKAVVDALGDSPGSFLIDRVHPTRSQPVFRVPPSHSDLSQL